MLKEHQSYQYTTLCSSSEHELEANLLGDVPVPLRVENSSNVSRFSSKSKLAVLASTVIALSLFAGTWICTSSTGSGLFSSCKDFHNDFESQRALVEPEPKDEANHFDCYIYTMTYQPGFCYGKDANEYPGCSHPKELYTKILTIHGLWPEVRKLLVRPFEIELSFVNFFKSYVVFLLHTIVQFNSGSWPQFCTDEKFDPAILSDLGEEMQTYWPDEKNDPSSSQSFQHTDFYAHEWTKHGTCTGMTQEAYFQTALALYIHPSPSDIIADNYGLTVDAQDLIDAYGGSGIAYPKCRGRYFKEVMICFGRNQASGKPTGPTLCPAHVKDKMEEDVCSGKVTLDRFKQEDF